MLDDDDNDDDDNGNGKYGSSEHKRKLGRPKDAWTIPT
jgi:hypothetical protein